MALRTCSECGAELYSIEGGAQTCSWECGKARAARHRQARRRERREEARRLNPVPPRACEHCGEPFQPVLRRARFCSDRCRLYAWRASS